VACVYWIHLPEHKDISSEGYVGVTSYSLEFRFDRHLNNTMNERKVCYRLEESLRVYGRHGVIVQKTLEGSAEYCLAVEAKLRPSPNIGWNLCMGGRKTSLGLRRSEATKAKINAAKVGRPRSFETRAKLSIRLMGNKCATGSIRTVETRAKLSAANKGKKNHATSVKIECQSCGMIGGSAGMKSRHMKICKSRLLWRNWGRNFYNLEDASAA
jgi:hypothetical protein